MDNDEISYDLADAEELEEQRHAQIALLACETTYNCMTSAISNFVLSSSLAARAKALQSTNRTFRTTRKTVQLSFVDADLIGSTTLLSDETRKKTSISSYSRDYEYPIALMAAIDKLKSNTIHDIMILDISGMLIGDKVLENVCANIKGLPIKSLILSGNNISDPGLKALGGALTFLPISHLNLADNAFSDDGLRWILSRDSFPKTIMSINLLRNRLGLRAAWWLGEKFDGRSDYKLTSISLGGRTSHLAMGLGDEFLSILVSFLCSKDAKSLTQFSFIDCDLSTKGVVSICLMLLFQHIVVLNVSGNSLVGSIPFLSLCLRSNSSLQRLRMYRCGLSMSEHDRLIKFIHLPKISLSWRIRADLAQSFAASFFEGYQSRENIYKLFGSALDSNITLFLPPNHTKLRSYMTCSRSEKLNSITKEDPEYDFVIKLSNKPVKRPLCDMISGKNAPMMWSILQAYDALRRTVEDLIELLSELTAGQLNLLGMDEVEVSKCGTSSVHVEGVVKELRHQYDSLSKAVTSASLDLLDNSAESVEELLCFQTEDLYSRLIGIRESLEEKVGATLILILKPKICSFDAERNLALAAPDPNAESTILVPLSRVLDPVALFYGYFMRIVRPKILERRNALLRLYETDNRKRLEKRFLRKKRKEKFEIRKGRLCSIVENDNDDQRRQKIVYTK